MYLGNVGTKVQMDLVQQAADFPGALLIPLRYVEVPLSFCPNHYMKNIFKDQIVGSNIPEYRDYDH
ncbi:hypothetical protein MSG28_013134 [Choristoneura fumiferana]|uniref:Uncharacterized protein n=1 Tax=Choristoneura fumiferana TaxID=7141 RepID=A0ACC0KRR5_CHOFU|nr:hypothetical protein MSG28_013134 [Choristoneura fumiferana]